MNGFSFNFVKNQLNRKYTNLQPICRITLVKDIENLTRKVETKISKDLPEKFGLFLDGWSDMGTSTHYMAIYAIFATDSSLLAFSPLENEEDYTARSQAEFIHSTLTIFQKDIRNIVSMIGDNEPKNARMASDMDIYFIGWYSHKLNLAVQKFLEPFGGTLGKYII